MHLMRAALARERQAHGSQAGLCRWLELEASRTLVFFFLAATSNLGGRACIAADPDRLHRQRWPR